MFRPILKLSSLLLVVAGVLSGATAVYQNTTTDTGDTFAYGVAGFTQVGDQIHLAGTERWAVFALAQLFNGGIAGTVDVQLRLFNTGSPVGNQIGPDFVRTAVSVPALADPSGGIFNVAFNLPNILVPDDLIFTLSVSNASAGVDVVGANMFAGPDLGFSDSSFAIANDGTNFVTKSTPGENVFFELDANATSPEPATVGCVALALALCVSARRRARG